MSDETTEPTLDPIPGGKGFRVLLRYGKERRGRFTIPIASKPRAAARAVALRDLASRLAVIDSKARAKIVLEEAAKAGNDRDFQGMLALATEEINTAKSATTAVTRPITFRDVGLQWTSGDLARLYPDQVRAKDATGDKARLAHLSAVNVGGVRLGDLPIASVTLDHAETAMRHLPEVKPATRRHYAQALHRVLALAMYPLRIIPANPLPKGFLPKVGKPPAFSYLYPSEDAALMAHGATSLGRRVLFGFLAREGMRLSEALSLRWQDIDLDRGVVTLDENKTDDARAWALDPGVTRALAAWRVASGGKAGPVFSDAGGPFEAKIAGQLRDDLQAAGVSRPELYTRTEQRKPLRVHDLRGTFVTLALAAGRSETWVADRTGHRSSIMINRYRRAARGASELGLGWLAPLDFTIPDLSPIPGMVAGLAAVSCTAAGPATDPGEGPGNFGAGDPGWIKTPFAVVSGVVGWQKPREMRARAVRCRS